MKQDETKNRVKKYLVKVIVDLASIDALWQQSA